MARAISGQAASLEDFDDAEILRQSGWHGVDLLLNEQLQQDTVTGVSEALKKGLKQAAYLKVAQDMLLNEATRALLDLLGVEQIPALLLKGTPVAHLYYPKTYLRPRCDTDLFIDENHLDETAQLLSANGYELSGLGARKHSSKQFVAAARSVQQNYLHFDFHWKLTNRVMFANTLPFAECLETCQPVVGLGPNAKTLANADLLVHACIHRIAHGRNTERNRLMWLYDIHLLWMAMDESERGQFIEKALHKKIGALCADALEISGKLFGSGGSSNPVKENNSLLANKPGDTPNQSRPAAPFAPTGETYSSKSDATLRLLSSQSGSEPSAKLIDASKLRWAWADLVALKGLKAKFAFTRELLRL